MKVTVCSLLLMMSTLNALQLPQYCNYSQETKTVECSNGYLLDIIQLIDTLPPDTLGISIQRSVIRSLPIDMSLLTMLKHISLTYCRIEEIETDAFESLFDLQTLNLEHNHIHAIGSSLFSSLINATSVSLANNHIQELPESVFTNMENLEVLNLRHNKLKSLNSVIFQDLIRLKSLDLSYNEIQHLSPDIFKPLLAVQIIKVHSNLLKTIHEDTFKNMSMLHTVSLEENPWQCNCGLKWLSRALKGGHKPIDYSHQEMIKCSSPQALHSLPLKHVALHRLKCIVPSIVSNDSSLSILLRSDITLRCAASGNPKPTIMWSTPRGQLMTVRSNPWWITPEFSNYSYSDVRYIMPYYTLTNLTVLDNGDLRLTNMHGIWTGEYKCLAMNPGGVDSITFNVTMNNVMPSIKIFSFIVGGMTAGVVVVLGALVCLFHQITRPKCCSVDTKSVSVKSGSPQLSITSDISPKRSPFFRAPLLFRESYMYSSAPSDEETDLVYDDDDITDTDDTTKGERGNHKIRETLDDVKARLRLGKAQLDERLRERRIQMRSQLQSIRESGSQYLQTIRDSSNKTASRVRSGVAIGMEHMKYHVRSLKEFCGTGDIGETMSTVTISTNVDTEERVEIIKSVTLV